MASVLKLMGKVLRETPAEDNQIFLMHNSQNLFPVQAHKSIYIAAVNNVSPEDPS